MPVQFSVPIELPETNKLPSVDVTTKLKNFTLPEVFYGPTLLDKLSALQSLKLSAAALVNSSNPVKEVLQAPKLLALDAKTTLHPPPWSGLACTTSLYPN